MMGNPETTKEEKDHLSDDAAAHCTHCLFVLCTHTNNFLIDSWQTAENNTDTTFKTALRINITDTQLMPPSALKLH